MLRLGFSQGQVLIPHHPQLHIYTEGEGGVHCGEGGNIRKAKLVLGKAAVQNTAPRTLEHGRANSKQWCWKWKMFPINCNTEHIQVWNSQISHSSETVLCTFLWIFHRPNGHQTCLYFKYLLTSRGTMLLWFLKLNLTQVLKNCFFVGCQIFCH